MQASFIIPLYNCLALTQECLRTLQATLPAGLAHEIIFVDDGSTDGTREWLATLSAPCRAILNERNLGFAGTCNRGAAAASGELLFFLNNDLILLPGWYEPMRRIATRDRKAALVGNVQVSAATGVIDHTGIFFDHKGKPQHDASRSWLSRLLGRREVPAITGACFAIRRAVWHELGAFDEGFINGGEDIDLCLRARAAGRRNYVSLRSVVRHHISQSHGRKLRDEHNSYRLMLRWRHAIARLAARAWCRYHLSLEWEEPRDFADQVLARDCFLYRWHFLPRPTMAILLGMNMAIETEMERWREMLR
ncbi:MAG: glycosyltransferase family 2 protein [Opitutae bacterium]|nr:glycosyltransferase family 2 protein [Opitutae bacterium]